MFSIDESVLMKGVEVRAGSEAKRTKRTSVRLRLGYLCAKLTTSLLSQLHVRSALGSLEDLWQKREEALKARK